MNDNSQLPAYIRRLTDRLEEMAYGEDLHVPESFDDLRLVAPDIAGLVAARPKPEQDLLFRCLGEAQAALLYEQCDALACGFPLSQSKKRNIFVRSFRTRVRCAYGNAASS